MNPRKAGCFLVLLLMACAPLALSQGTYTQIDVPGATNTVLSGIDTAGDIVGSYQDTGGFEHGFILSGGSYTTIDYPGATNTILSNVNDKGQIVGSTASPYIGFSYDVATQLFTIISVPRPRTVTYPFAINNAGTIAGGFYNGDGAFGFEFAGSTYRKIRPLDASDAFVYGISDSGKLAGHGTSRKLGTIVNFLFRHGVYSPINIPNASEAQVYGMNLAGTILVGFYRPPSGNLAGFSFQNGTTQELDFPGAVDTVAFGANNAGEIVGNFTDGTNSHGFTWTPPGDLTKK